MSRVWVKLFLWMLVVLGLVGSVFTDPIKNTVMAQQPTGSIPTVTGTPPGPYITVNMDQDFINVRSGPNSHIYPKIGILTAGQSAPALGRSPGGDWIMISYPGVPGSVGWIYAPNVSLSSQGFLPIVDPPPTPTPLAAPTIDPTLAAAFIANETPTRLPTFTPPAPLAIPTFTDATSGQIKRMPMGLIIIGLGFIGAFGALISFLRR